MAFSDGLMPCPSLNVTLFEIGGGGAKACPEVIPHFIGGFFDVFPSVITGGLQIPHL
jgi:hypothetical protein